MEFKKDYWQDQKLKKSFDDLMVAVFEWSFLPWDKKGFWDDEFRPFTYFKDGKAISSVCLYELDMVFNGKKQKAAELSSVATLEHYRNQGLNRELTQVATKEASKTHPFVFLFSAEKAIAYYQKLGFKPIDEWLPVFAKKHSRPKDGLRKLDVTDENSFRLIQRIAQNRAPASLQLGTLHHKLLMFHVIFRFDEHCYYVEELDTLVLYKLTNDRLTIFDIVSEKTRSWPEIAPYLAYLEYQELAFHFMIDQLQIQEEPSFEKLEDSHLHILGDPPWGEKITIPFTARA
jgi:N-acetylglutamate synthase-like GNAT family acetyltransferase